MATLTRGQTFGITESVTNTKLHNLVDNATISEIVNADIGNSAAIDDLKLAAITRANKVSGTALYNISSLPTSAGYIPAYNISISQLPATLISLVSGKSLFNIASIPTLAGQFPFSALVNSLASGSYPIFNGSTSFVGAVLSGWGVPAVVAGTGYTLASANTERTAGDDTRNPVKVKDIIVVRSGTVSVSFDGHYASGAGPTARIYKNGSAAGTSQVLDTNYTTYTETISVTAGDLVQLYVTGEPSGRQAVVRNFQIKATIPATDTVNTD